MAIAGATPPGLPTLSREAHQRDEDLLPSFEGLARTRSRAARMFVALVEGEIVKQDNSWTKTRVLGTEPFVKKILGWTGESAADPPL